MINNTSFQGKKAAYYTLGCKLNFAETSTFAEMLAQKGVVTASKGEVADLCLINTCSVTEVADRKCRQAIRRMARQHPGAFVVVTGCYAQLSPTSIINIEGVDLVLGSNEKATLIERLSEHWTEKLGNLNNSESAEKLDAVDSVEKQDAVDSVEKHDSIEKIETLEKLDAFPSSQAPPSSTKVFVVSKPKEITTFAPSCSRGNRTRYFLKVQDGCNHFCTYCTIPFARGMSRNASIAFLVSQAEEVVSKGGKEIVITGVNIGDFGKSTGETFLDLIRALDGVQGIQRYRISSIEPELLTDQMIDFCASSRAFMPHFHIPLQSGSDAVLRLMHRRYDTALFREKIERIKHCMPEAFIGVDVMVGTRGETPEYFEETFQFLDSLDVTQLHVFPYSERPGTAALRIPYIVSDADKKERVNRLLLLSEQKTRAFYLKHIGQQRPVLFERTTKGRLMHGFTDNYIRVETTANDSLDNQITTVTLGDLNLKGDALRCSF